MSNSGSFSAAAKDVAVEALTAQGCSVEISDLYAMSFKAAATADDIKGLTFYWVYLNSKTILAFAEGRLSEDIAKEHAKISDSHMCWFGLPAIMKGWLDRVLTNGFAFSGDAFLKTLYYVVHLQDKKTILSFTTGSLESMFSPTGINGDMNVTLWPIQNGILHYCGFQVLAPQIFWAPSSAAAGDRTNMLEGWRTRLQGLLEETPLSFTPLDCFDQKTCQLKPDVREKHASKEFGLTVGIHLNKPPPPQPNESWGCVTLKVTRWL
uniref:NAD(P)H quinone dehydrogenase 1 n=1 Tax=Nothobranchius furzeri TaxID=105023 RepID=A0A8C6LUG1_NOTFU